MIKHVLPLFLLIGFAVTGWLIPQLIEKQTFYQWVAKTGWENIALWGGLIIGFIAALSLVCVQIGAYYLAKSHKTRQLLDRQKQFSDGVTNTIDVGVMACNEEGRLIQINEAMKRLYGIRGKAVLAKASAKVYQLYPIDGDTPLEWSQTPLGIASGKQTEVHDQEVIVRPQDDEPRILLCSARPIMSGKKQMGAVMAAQDITAFRHAQNAMQRYADTMQRSGADLQKVAFIAAHNLQEPSRGITSYAQLLEMSYKDKLDETGVEYIGFIVDEAKRLKSQLADLLQYLETGAETGEPAQVDLNKTLDNVRSVVRTSLSAQDKDFSIQGDNLPTISGHPKLLETLFFHLIDNAIKFNENMIPTIVFSAQQRDEDWLFNVQDNGLGIEPEYNEKIFELFQTIHPIGTYPGTGLGLAIAKKIVTLHGGEIHVEQLEAGSRFVFNIPFEIPTGEIE